MEESFKEWTGHAGMLSGCAAACGASCQKRDTWKRDNASAMELFIPAIYGLQLHVCYAGRAAQKYSNLMRAMMSVVLVCVWLLNCLWEVSTCVCKVRPLVSDGAPKCKVMYKCFNEGTVRV